MDIEIIDKADMPAGRIRWKRLLIDLAYNKAVKLVFPSGDEAKRQRNNIQSDFRKSRMNKQGFDIFTQVTQLTENQWALFIWKEEKSNE